METKHYDYRQLKVEQAQDAARRAQEQLDALMHPGQLALFTLGAVGRVIKFPGSCGPGRV